MRRLPLVLLLVSACHTDLGAPSGGVDYVPAVVVDSVTHAPLGSVSVATGGTVSVTTAGGTFMFPAVAATDTVRINAAGYEPFTTILPAGVTYRVGDTVRFALRRIGPFATRCVATVQGFQAAIVDLQGRLPVEQLEQSSVEVGDSTTPLKTVAGTEWQRVPVSDWEWTVIISPAPSKTVFAWWDLHDPAGPHYSGWCQPDSFHPK